jgi:hypothetical protein
MRVWPMLSLSLAGKNRTWLMCQHYSGHKVKQLYAANRSLLATDNHWLNAVALCCKRPQYIRI